MRKTNCSKCQILLTKENKAKRNARCKPCHAKVEKERGAIYHSEHAEERAEYSKTYKASHKEKTAASKKKYTETHSDQISAKNKEKRLKKSGLTEEKIAAILAKWELWYPNYVIHQKANNVKFEYSVELTVIMKRYLMKSWMTNMRRDFSLDNVVA